MFSDRRGVSETVGFVLVFSLILLTVGTVLTVGYAGLQDARDAERVNNAERAFDVLADNLEDITARGAPSRGTEIRLAEASLGPGQATTLNVSGYESDDSLQFDPVNESLGAVVYEAEGTRIRYAGGAVTRVQSGGSVLLGEPDFVVSDRRVIIPMVELTVEERSVAGSRTVLVRSERILRNTTVDANEVDRLELEITSPAADAWEEYLDGPDMDCSRPDGDDGRRVSCHTENVDSVQVVRFVIDVTFE